MALEFQIYDYVEDHANVESDEEYKPLGDYIIHVFGRTMDDKSVYAKVTGFTPYFYIGLPQKWQSNTKTELKKKVEILEKWLRSKDNKYVWYRFKDTLLSVDYVKRKKTDGFTNDKEYNFARLVFRNSDGMKKFASLFEKNGIMIPGITTKPVTFKLYESNLAPMLRCFHIRKISGCSWVSTSSFTKIKSTNKESYCNIEINVDWQDLSPIQKDCNAPLRIASFDIECYSHDGQFPQAYRKKDPIIQIGISYTKLGQSIPYRKWIACLDKTDPIDSIEVVSCETETEIIEAWINEINQNDCDIITGYNIFFFDEKYMYDRCEKILNMQSEIAYISKLKNRYCKFKEIKLASSALGENLLKYWDTPGRVHIDLMKDVQKTFNLPSYKLDFVASNFIRGEIKQFKLLDDNIIEFECEAVDDIEINDYIHIEVIKGFVSDDIGEKYLVNKINRETKKLYIKGDSILEAELEISKHGGKIFWSQAKDDVGPKEIFAYQMKGPAERAIVAKYCLKDCSLVNLLINKLEVVTKNLEMANVCYVPLSYLFVRGQGIKLFSLCLKEFREQEYVFPVIKVKKDADGNLEKEDSYEGAIVFDPVAQIDYEANTTKDYASLYPSAIMHKNMSHETEVTDPDYDNIEGVEYFNASFRENDGTTKYIRFAKIGDKLGVIPTILSNLLRERKLVKKLMKNEKDPFKYRILDAKQLAVKITANSLYGQLGAGTSPVANRNIAACTTSTGREMLLFAKKYDEEILPWIINGLKDAYENNDTDRVNAIINLELKNKDPGFIEKLQKYCSSTIKDYTLQPVIRYGDSVASYTPVYVRHNNSIDTCTIEELANKYGKGIWIPCIDKEEKETCELEGVESWTDKGWTKLDRIIRHMLAPNKKMIRIITDTALVDVTDDHSLLLLDGKEISPKKCKVGTELLHYNLPQCSTSQERLYCFTYFDINDQISAAKLYWEACNKGLDPYIDIPHNEQNRIRISINEPGTPRKNPNMIKKMYHIDYEGYVYDLTTDNHHFAAGIGNMIVHNTDSVFACFRFKEKKEELSNEESLVVLQKIIKFGEELLKPFFLPTERELFCTYYNEYYGDVTDLTLPMYPQCVPEPKHNKIILPVEDRMKQCVKEYLYENYFSWLWTLQEIINKNFDNLDIKLLNWATYLLSKFRFTYNDLIDNRKDEVLNPLIKNLEKIYNSEDQLIWHKATPENINEMISHFKNIFTVELKKTDTELNRLVKEFMDTTLIEEWIHAEKAHNVKATRERKKLKRERKYNDKHLYELLVLFIENRLKLDFNKYKNEHYDRINNFIKNELKDYIVQPWWDIKDNTRVYKIKIYNGSDPIIDKRTLDFSIELGELSGELVKSRLPFPHDLEYEKTFWPFMILTKKRYVGNKYEFNPNKFKQDFMGIVLKRRDNAPIVKEICSGIIDYLINKRDPLGAKKFTQKCLDDMFCGKYDIKYFLQSRTVKLKESYKDWTRQAHICLSERIAAREGSKPESGNRLEFVVVVPENPDDKKLLLGDMIETPAYIKQNNISINYMFYMKNQIMIPALQFLALVDKNAEEMFKNMEKKYGKIKPKKEPKKVSKKTSKPKKKITEKDISLKKIVTKSSDKIIDSDTSDQTISDKIDIIIDDIIEVPVKKSKKSKKIDIEEPVIEVPVKKSKKSKKIVEEPVIEEPVKKSKKSKKIVEEPDNEEPVKKSKKSKKIVEEVIEEPVKKSKKSKKIVEEVIEEPVKKSKKSKKIVEEQDIEEPVIEEQDIEEPVIEEQDIEEQDIEEQDIEEPVIEEQDIEEPVIEESIKKSKKSKKIIEEPVVEEPVKKSKKSKKIDEEPLKIIKSKKSNQVIEI